jgi:hypothetical protein
MQNPPVKGGPRIPRPKMFCWRLVVGFDQSTADRIADIASQRCQSRGQVIRELVETGLYVEETFQ